VRGRQAPDANEDLAVVAAAPREGLLPAASTATALASLGSLCAEEGQLPEAASEVPEGNAGPADREVAGAAAGADFLLHSTAMAVGGEALPDLVRPTIVSEGTVAPLFGEGQLKPVQLQHFVAEGASGIFAGEPEEAGQAKVVSLPADRYGFDHRMALDAGFSADLLQAALRRYLSLHFFSASPGLGT
jgi:hypothetical protein